MKILVYENYAWASLSSWASGFNTDYPYLHPRESRNLARDYDCSDSIRIFTGKGKEQSQVTVPTSLEFSQTYGRRHNDVHHVKIDGTLINAPSIQCVKDKRSVFDDSHNCGVCLPWGTDFFQISDPCYQYFSNRGRQESTEVWVRFVKWIGPTEVIVVHGRWQTNTLSRSVDVPFASRFMRIWLEGNTTRHSTLTVPSTIQALFRPRYDQFLANPVECALEWTRELAAQLEFIASTNPALAVYRNGTLTAPGTQAYLPPSFSRIAANLFPPTQPVDWSRLAAQAYQKVEFLDFNGIAYISDLCSITSSVQSLAETAKRTGPIGKKVANSYLALHYGLKLLAADTKELIRAFRRLSKYSLNRRVSGSTTSETCGIKTTWTYSVHYRFLSQVSSAYEQLVKLIDADLDLTNMWDLTPWTFVIDWFIGVGDVLAAIDGYMSLRQDHEVTDVGYSIKKTRTLSPDQMGFRGMSGTVVATSYDRWYTGRLIEPSFLPEQPTNGLANHFVEGAALVISRR